MVNIKFSGDWVQVKKLIANLQKDGQKIVENALQSISIETQKIAKNHITSQDISWTPLREKYKSYKKKQGFSEKILVRTGSYFENITIAKEKNRAFIGVKKTAKSKEGKSLADIARVLEYGSVKMNIPPRQLWSVVLAETKTFAPQEVEKQVKNYYRKKYKASK